MKTSLSNHLTRSILLISIPAVMVIFVTWIAGELVDFRKETERLKNEYTLSQKSKIQTEVNRVVDYIESKREASRSEVKSGLKEAVYAVNKDILQSIDSKRPPNQESLEKLLVGILNSRKISGKETNFFLINYEDNRYIFGPNTELMHLNLARDDSAIASAFKTIQKIVTQNSEGFAEYNLSRSTGPNNGINRKTSFVKRIEGTNLVLGAAQYIDEFIAKEKASFIEWIKHVRFDNGQGYIFLDDFNGYSIYNIHTDLIGKDLNYLRDENGVMITDEERRAALKPDGDYIYYSWRRAPGLPLSPKVSFVRGIKEYSWMVGAGVYIDDIENVIENNRDQMKRAIINKILTIVALLVIIAAITVFFGRVYAKKLEQNFLVFKDFFKIASKHHQRIDTNRLQFVDFIILAEFSNDMVDERERIINDLEKNRMRLHYALEASRETIWEWNTITNELYRSARYFRLLSRDANPDGEIGMFRDWYEEMSEDEKPLIAERIEEFLDGKKEYLQFEFKIQSASGKTIWFQTIGKAIESGQNGNPVRVIGTIVDITERKNYEQKIVSLNEVLEFKVTERTAQLEDALEELKFENDERKRTQLELYKAKDDLSEALKREKELSQMKSSFISMVSHEYRTPMTVISLSSALLKKYNEVGDKANFNTTLAKIDSSIQTMNHLIDDVLLFGKSETGRLTATFSQFNLDELATQVIEQARIIDKNSHVLVYEKINHNLPINSDKKILEQVLINIMTNACKYSPADEEIVLSISIGEDSYIISIKDYGVGIPKDEVERIFDPFYRASNSSIAPGTGLGLSIVKRSAAMLGGDITVESELEKGSIFTLTIPKEKKEA